ncbi:hypothetical protein ACSBR1_034954 [Camellia fascicularis]
MKEDMVSLCRTCLLEHEKSRTSCFTAKKSKPVKTTSVSEKMGNLKSEDGLIKSKLRALTILYNSKKEKQPISTGVKLASILNSLFHNGNSTKTKNSGSSSTGGYGDVHVERKAKSTQASTCSRASS